MNTEETCLEEQSPTVLVAEDNAVFRKVLERDLKKWGFCVAMASDGTEALALYDKHPEVRILILDWMMPGCNGLDVIRQVRSCERGKYAYIILLTAKGQSEDIVAGLSGGADDYIIKPFDEHELEVRVRAGKRIIDLQDELIGAREALRFQATHDALTQLWNRAEGIAILTRELERAERHGHEVSAVMVDIDHFKQINDTYGHLAGDMALKWISKTLQESLRPYDSVCRYGGEEFLVVLPRADRDAARSVAERIRFLVEQKSVRAKELHTGLTVSVGVAVASRKCFSVVDDLIYSADVALYKAKESGRNRVMIWEPTDDKTTT